MKKQTRVAELLAELQEYRRKMLQTKFAIYDDLETLSTTKDQHQRNISIQRIKEKLKEIK